MHIENKGFKLQTCVDVQIYSYSNSSNVQYQCSSIQSSVSSGGDKLQVSTSQTINKINKEA